MTKLQGTERFLYIYLSLSITISAYLTHIPNSLRSILIRQWSNIFTREQWLNTDPTFSHGNTDYSMIQHFHINVQQGMSLLVTLLEPCHVVNSLQLSWRYAFENVVFRMLAILSQPQCVNSSRMSAVNCVSKPSHHGPLTRYVKLQVAHAPGMPGTFSPAADFKGNR